LCSNDDAEDPTVTILDEFQRNILKTGSYQEDFNVDGFANAGDPDEPFVIT
jgi:hypothetical protein